MILERSSHKLHQTFDAVHFLQFHTFSHFSHLPLCACHVVGARSTSEPPAGAAAGAAAAGAAATQDPPSHPSANMSVVNMAVAASGGMPQLPLGMSFMPGACVYLRW
jgi:hypothetical protein